MIHVGGGSTRCHGKPRLQFICKRRSSSGNHGHGVAYGLVNSAELTARALREHFGWEVDVAVVVDNNSIDREVTRFRPEWVFIEALWVVPEKFKVLMRLHPRVKWVIRNHSEIPFLSNEGKAFHWLYEYQELALYHPEQIFISSNSSRASEDLEVADILSENLPNVYAAPPIAQAGKLSETDGALHIGCFGSVRPMKNHVLQALAAIDFASRMGQPLVFHVNGERHEQFGENNLKNLEEIFRRVPNARLEKHPWLSHSDFLHLVSSMDLGMQVSLTESFNIVTADFVTMGVPIVVSPVIRWMPAFTQADPNRRESMVHILNRLDLLGRFGVYFQQQALAHYNRHALRDWKHFIHETEGMAPACACLHPNGCSRC